MTEPGTDVVEFDPTEGGKYCGAKTRPGARHPYCRQVAGHRTDHVGQGRCRLHGGATPITTGRGSRNTSLIHRIKRPRVRELLEEAEAIETPLNTLPELAIARGFLIEWVERYDEWMEAFLAWHADWSFKYLPISEENERALLGSLEEYGVLCADHGIELSDQQRANLDKARQYVERLKRTRLDGNPKPRQVLDVTAVMGHVDTISKLAEREWQRLSDQAISRKDLDRLIRQLGAAVEKRVRLAMPDEPDDPRATALLKLIRSDWLTIAVSSA